MRQLIELINIKHVEQDLALNKILAIILLLLALFVYSEETEAHRDEVAC